VSFPAFVEVLRKRAIATLPIQGTVADAEQRLADVEKGLEALLNDELEVFQLLGRFSHI
jgi:hypothetical protein